MADGPIEIIRDLFSQKEIAIAALANGSSHLSFAAMINGFDRLNPTSTLNEKQTMKEKIRDKLIRSSGYVAAVAPDVDHFFGYIFHNPVLGFAFDVLLSGSLTLLHRENKKKAFGYYLLLTMSNQFLIDPLQTYNYESMGYYNTMTFNSLAITAANIGVRAAKKLYTHFNKSKLQQKIALGTYDRL
jgi:hypothetical protein